MKYSDLREFLSYLEQINDLVKITDSVSPILDMTEFCSQVLAKQGPAVLFENPTGYTTKCLGNLFGTTNRIAYAMGYKNVFELKDLGIALAAISQPTAPSSLKEAIAQLPLLRKLFNMIPTHVKRAKVRDIILHDKDVDLSQLPIWQCHANDVGQLITCGLVITRGPYKPRQNLGIYRMQVLNKNKVIMRWLHHRGGALDYAAHARHSPTEPYPISIAIGADPATILAAVAPIPDHLSEYQFAGLLRGNRTQLIKSLNNDLSVPANAEIVLEGAIYPGDVHQEGPFGDHTGYYNEMEEFPVMTIKTISMRHDAIYHSTYTGKPPDEPSTLGLAFNEIFIPILQKQFPEITDFYLPAECCSYRMAIVAIRKQYAGHAKRIMFGIWGVLSQFMYTKFIIVLNDNVDIRSWTEVMWAISTKVDPVRDTTLIDHTPIDYLDFASPIASLGGKIGIDATDKLPGEVTRTWGELITPNQEVRSSMQILYDKYF